MAHIVVDRGKCTGCGICMLACSEVKEQVYQPSHARIRIYREKLPHELGIDYCRQCDDAPCAEACPVNAISQEELGTWLVDEGKCIGCGKCVEACPFDAIFMNNETKKAFKCDLCGGSPECIKQCPKDAIIMED